LFFVNFSGGFGNQIIQFLFAIRLRACCGQRVAICVLDPKYTVVSKSIIEVARKNKIRVIHCKQPFFSRRFRRITRLNRPRLGFISNFDEVDFNSLSSFMCQHLIFDGYWQSPRNFLKLSQMNFDWYADKKPVSDERLNGLCVIHFRLGDYQSLLNRIVFSPVRVDFFKRAIARISAKSPGIRFCVCSNGSRTQVELFCRDVGFDDGDVYRFDGDWLETFELMTSASYLIGSNSTFSLMAFFLGREAKISAFFPLVWFRFGAHPLALVKKSLPNLNLI